MKKVMAGLMTLAVLAGTGSGITVRANDTSSSISSSVSTSQPTEIDKEVVLSGMWRLNKELGKVLADKNEGKNVVYSSFSLYTALAAVREGARGETRKELEDFLSLSPDEDIREQMKKAQEVSEDTHGDLKITNGLLYSNDYSPKKEYMDLLKVNFGTELMGMDFSDPEKATKQVNDWITEKTEGYIEGNVNTTPDTIAELFNIVLFQGEWVHPFSESGQREFTLKDGRKIEVPTMSKKTNSMIMDGDDFKGYKETTGGTNVWFLLPDPGVDPTEIDSIALFKGEDPMTGVSDDVTVFMPIISVPSQKYPLKDILQDMGVKSIFQDNADLTGIAEKIKVSNVNQTTRLDILTKGVKAAAVTEVQMEKVMAVPGEQKKPTVLNFDRPYLVVIEKDGYPLFTAVIQNPLN